MKAGPGHQKENEAASNARLTRSAAGRKTPAEPARGSRSRKHSAG